MKVRGLENIRTYQASILESQYGTTIAQGRALKLGEEVDVSDDVAKKLINAELVSAVIPDIAAPVPVSQDETDGA